MECILNESSNRLTPPTVSFTKNERLYGDEANLIYESNYQNTIMNIQRFMGMKYNSPLLKEEAKYCFAKIVPSENMGIAFEVSRQKNTEVYTPEQICAMLFKKLKKNYEDIGISSPEVVISVPHYFTVIERQAVLDAGKIAGLNIIKLMNENLATGFEYGFFRLNSFNESPRYVAFADMGHCKKTVYIIGFTNNGMNIISQVFDKYLGGRTFDWLLMEKISQEFMTKYNLNPIEYPKAFISMQEAVERCRKMLSASNSARINIENLLNNKDIDIELTREEFEKLVQPLTQRVISLCEKALKISKLDLTHIHSVELVGEATRIPIVRQSISLVFPNIEIMRTLNSSECVARGCAMMAAKLSPNFKVRDYQANDCNVYPIEICYTSAMKNGQQQIKNAILFDSGAIFPLTKNLTYEGRKDPIDIALKYTDTAELSQGSINLLGHYRIEPPIAKELKWSIIVKIKLDNNMIAQISSVEHSEDYYEDQKVPVKKDQSTNSEATKKDETNGKEGKNTQNINQLHSDPLLGSPPIVNKEYEIQKVLKNRRTNIDFKYEVHGLNSKKLIDFYNWERKLQEDENLIIGTNKKRVMLEGFLYDMRSKLNDENFLGHYADEDRKSVV